MVNLKEYPFKSNYIKTGHLNYHFIDEGKGEPFLFVHGNPTWSYYYRNLISHFSKTNRCIAVDHIGCGLSDKPLHYDYTLKKHVENLEYLILKLNLNNITLLVHDWGGAIGMGVATKHPDRFKRIVLFNTGAFRSNLIPLRINICRIPYFGDIAVRQFNLFLLASFYMGTAKPDIFTNEIKQGYLFPYNSYKNRIAIHRFIKDIPLDPNDRSYGEICRIENSLTSLSHLPIKIIWGEQDFCFNTEFYKKWLEIFPHAEAHLINDSGHYVVEDAKEQIISLIQKFTGN